MVIKHFLLMWKVVMDEVLYSIMQSDTCCPSKTIVSGNLDDLSALSQALDANLHRFDCPGDILPSYMYSKSTLNVEFEISWIAIRKGSGSPSASNLSSQS